MPPLIRLIWDFRGADAQATAEHHARHLLEFAKRERLAVQETGARAESSWHAVAWMLAQSEDVPRLRAVLRPSRGLPVDDTAVPAPTVGVAN